MTLPLNLEQKTDNKPEESTGAMSAPEDVIFQSPMAPMPTQVITPRSDSSWKNNFHEFDPTNYDMTDYGPDELNQPEVPQQQKKKGNFFSSLFKKPPKKSKKSRPKSEYLNYDAEPVGGVPTSYEHEGVYRAGEEEFKSLERSKSQPVVPQPGTQPHMEFPPPPTEEELGYKSDDEQFTPKPLQRKLSMSKPTNLDDILRQQQEEEQQQDQLDKGEPKRVETITTFSDTVTSTTQDVFLNDPWFQSRMLPEFQPKPQSKPNQQPLHTQPVYANMPSANHPVFAPSHETTQEIDVDAALGFYDDDDIEEPVNEGVSEVDQIEWPKGSSEQIPHPEQQRNIEIDYEGTKQEERFL